MSTTEVRPGGHSLADPAVRVAVVLPALAVVVYAIASRRVADPSLVVACLTGLAAIVLVAIVRPFRGEQAHRWELLFHIVGFTVGVTLLAVLLLAGLAVDIERFSLIVAVVLVVGSYLLPPPARWPVVVWTLLVWAATLWWGGVRDVHTLILHLGGGLLVLATSSKTADALAMAIRQEEASRAASEERARLLSSVLRTNTLEPTVVFDAVTAGLRSAGFDVVSIREIDRDTGTLRLVASSGIDRDHVDEVLPGREGLAARAIATGEPLVVDRYADTPDAQQVPFPLEGVIAVPVQTEIAAGLVVLAGRHRGRLTDPQREAAVLLAEQAGRALVRAEAFAVDERTIDQLRQLDSRTQDFVSTVSHELRTPLTVVQGLGQTLTRRWDDLDDRRRGDLLARIDANAERLGVMVRSLLDTSALSQGRLDLQLQAVTLRTEILALLHRLATVTAAHPVHVIVPSDLEVEVDPGLFQHVLENLLTNVAKHTPQGTRVHVSAVPIDDRVRIEVADEGPGIPPEEVGHVLERFYRGGEPTRRATGGLGLGLALAQQIVRAHGSGLEVSSRPGEGTTFWFSVRRAPVTGADRASAASR